MTVPPPPTSAGIPSAPQQLIYGLFRPECYRTFFVDHNFLDFGCLALLLSKILSYGIILGALLVKLPQIFKIAKSRSTAGLAPSMYILENVGYAIAVAYNVRNGYAFSTFGENVFILIQGIIICVLLVVFAEKQAKQSRTLAMMVGAPLFLAFVVYLGFYCSLSQLAWFQTSTIGIFACSRVPQIISNFSRKSTGQLAVVTVALNSLGSMARVFTTAMEVKDTLVLTGMISGATLNAILLAQMIWYWNSKGAAAGSKAGANKASQKKKKAAADAAAAAAAAAEDAWMDTVTPSKKGKKGKKQQ